jgi:elongation factor Ts
MVEITAQMVKELREKTGAGMMECKKALQEADGDLEGAVDVLRTRGVAMAAKRAGRATNEGLLMAVVSEDGKAAAIVELDCETDFVSRNDVFAGYARKVAEAVIAADPADLETLKAVTINTQTVEDLIVEAIHTIGENIQISNFIRRTVETGFISSYIHAGGSLGVLVRFQLGNQDSYANEELKVMGKDIAMQVAAANPAVIKREEYSQDIIERELAIYRTVAEESGKPENIQEQMVEGQLKKFYAETVLLEPSFVKEPKKTIEKLIAETSKSVGDSIEVQGYDRLLLGQF